MDRPSAWTFCDLVAQHTAVGRRDWVNSVVIAPKELPHGEIHPIELKDGSLSVKLAVDNLTR